MRPPTAFDEGTLHPHMKSPGHYTKVDQIGPPSGAPEGSFEQHFQDLSTLNHRFRAPTSRLCPNPLWD